MRAGLSVRLRKRIQKEIYQLVLKGERDAAVEKLNDLVRFEELTKYFGVFIDQNKVSILAKSRLHL